MTDEVYDINDGSDMAESFGENDTFENSMEGISQSGLTDPGDIGGIVDTLDNLAGLAVSDEELNNLADRAEGLERAEHKDEPRFGSRKCCPTRHGCQGATDCDYSYGSYPF